MSSRVARRSRVDYCPPETFVRLTEKGTSMRKIGFVLAAALLAACGSARVVQRNQVGGVIALNGDQGKAMEEAHREMAAHCGPGNYTIVQEGEVVIGQDTVARADTYDHQDGTTTTAGTSTRDAKEWRITYQCGGVAAAPAPAPGPAPMGPPPPPPGPAPAPGY
jgi:hypothetical protein